MPKRKSAQSERRSRRVKGKPYTMPITTSWNTAEVAEHFGIPRPNLVRWVKLGLIPITKRTPAGAPVWFDRDLVNLEFFLGRHKRYGKHKREAAA